MHLAMLFFQITVQWLPQFSMGILLTYLSFHVQYHMSLPKFKMFNVECVSTQLVQDIIFLFFFLISFQEYDQKFKKVTTVRKELESHIQKLPDLTLLPDVTGGLAPLPSAGDLFSLELWKVYFIGDLKTAKSGSLVRTQAAWKLCNRMVRLLWNRFKPSSL